MAIDTSNLKKLAMRNRALMEDIATEHKRFFDQGNEHLSDLKQLRKDVEEMDDDLQASVSIMGNSGGETSSQG